MVTAITTSRPIRSRTLLFFMPSPPTQKLSEQNFQNRKRLSDIFDRSGENPFQREERGRVLAPATALG
jgi:hypothetical protein